MKEKQIYQGRSSKTEITFTEMVQILWFNKWIVVSFTLVFAIVAFVISLILPKQYQAKATLAIQQPKLQVHTQDGFVLRLKEPDLKILVEMAKSPAVFQTLAADPDIRDTWSESNISLDWQTLAKRSRVNPLGNGGLQLVVQDTNPQRAALLANRWALEIAQHINSDYGYTKLLVEMASRVEDAHRRYQQAETEYTQALSHNRQAILTSQLKRTQNDLNCVLARESDFQRLEKDLQAFAIYLHNLQKNVSLTPGDALALAVLQQRVLATKVCTTDVLNLQTQWQARDLAALTVVDALNLVEEMQVILEQRTKTLPTQQVDLEQQLLQLQQALEEERSWIEELAHQRDLAWMTYQSLVSLQTQQNALITKSNNVAAIVAEAVAPTMPSSPHVVMNTVLAAATGFILAMIWILSSAWRQQDRDYMEMDENG